jgi:ubiquinone/menaquinone biosynthesis C-methylase UbiE
MIGNQKIVKIQMSSILKKIIQKIVTSMLLIEKNSWREHKIKILIFGLINFPKNKIKNIRRKRGFVENQYDHIAGLYIKDNYYEGRERFSVVDGEVKKINSIKNMQKIRTEINSVLGELKFNSILEIGVGELTSLEAIYREFEPDIDCYGIDLSFNRIYHGLAEYKKRHQQVPRIAKADATVLPFPDNSFDLVYTRHTLEQMPTVFERAMDEIFRVAKNNIVLFEPSFELGSFTQKIKMINSDYVRGIPSFLKKKVDVRLNEVYLMKNSANPLNHTACFKINVDKNGESNELTNKSIDLVSIYTR